MTQKKIHRTVVQLKSKTWITPHYIRAIFNCDEINKYENTSLGDNNKIFIAPNDVDKIYFPDEKSKQDSNEDNGKIAIMRTYTHRAIDIKNKELTIDFIDHGDHGVASKWIRNAHIGGEIGLAMRTDPKMIIPKDQKDILLIGDATALPLFCTILESTQEYSKITAIIEVNSKEDELDLKVNKDVDIIWLHNSTPINGSSLYEEVLKKNVINRNRYTYIAAEYSTVKAFRKYLKEEIGLENSSFFAFSYWKAGSAELDSAKERKLEKES